MAFLALLGLVALSACLPPPAKEFDLDCPEPVVECLPGSWKGVPFDTAARGPGETYLRIEPVAGLNSQDGEFTLAFRSETEALMTVGNGGLQRLVEVELSQAARGKSAKSLSIPGMRTFGASTLTPSGIFSGVSDQAVTGDANIYVAEGRAIGQVTPIKELNTDLWWDGHPTLSPAGDVVIFASERPSSLGGTDLYYSVRSANGWSVPQSCGAALNTICDELSPFVAPGGKTLLFASSGHATLGGYDIFRVSVDFAALRAGKSLQAFGTVQNMGAPLNTPSDELFPSTPGRPDSLLYYSSNQSAPAYVASGQHGGFDLYVMHPVRRGLDDIQPVAGRTPTLTEKLQADQTTERIEPDPQTSEPIAETTNPDPQTSQPKTEDPQEEVLPERDLVVEGSVVDRGTKKPIPDAIVTVTELKTGEVRQSAETAKDGSFRLESRVRGEVEVSAQAETYFPRTSRVDAETEKTERGFELTASLTLRLNFPNDIYLEPYPNVLDSNGRQTNQTWQEAVTGLAKHINLYQKSIKSIVLIGHTDEKSSEEYNLMLGKRRADFLKTQLIKRGVDAALLVTNSAGETRPLIRRPSEDLETFHSRCRRVEIRKILRE